MKATIDLDTKAWLSDSELRLCGPLERGVLIDLMCIARSGRPEGHVTTAAGAAIPDASLAMLLHMSDGEFLRAKARLLEYNRIGVAEQTGAIFVPRMVRDAAIREQAAEGGRKGGNPALLPGLGDEPQVAKRVVPITVGYFYAGLPKHLQTPEMRDAVSEWIEYRQRKRYALTTAAVRREINTLTPLTAQQAVEWIACAIDKQWRGFYPPPRQLQQYDRTTTTPEKQKEFTGHARVRTL